MTEQPVGFTSDGLRLAGRLFLPDGTLQAPGLCICHGIPAVPFNPSEEGYAVLARRFAGGGFATLLFNFRGAGLSEGNFDMAGWTRDLDRAVGCLASQPRVDPDRIFLLGFSGGAAAAICMAAHSEVVRGVVSCAAPAVFDDLFAGPAMDSALAHWREIGIIRDASFPPDRSAWERGFREVEPVSHVSRIAPRPLLILHGGADEVVPVAHASRLYEAAREPKELAIVAEGRHRLRVDERAMDLAANRLKRWSAG